MILNMLYKKIIAVCLTKKNCIYIIFISTWNDISTIPLKQMMKKYKYKKWDFGLGKCRWRGSGLILKLRHATSDMYHHGFTMVFVDDLPKKEHGLNPRAF